MVNHVIGWILLLSLAVGSLGCTSAAPATSPGAGGASGATKADSDVQQVYDALVKQQMPNVPIELVQAAKREGSFNYYHLASPGHPKLIAAFNERFPFVKGQGFQLTGAALMERFRSEETAGTHVADVWVNSSVSAADELVNLGLVMEYTPANGAKIPPQVQEPGRWYSPGFTPMVAAWNTKLVPDADAKRVLATWKGLGDPYWQGKTLGYLDFRAGGTAQVTMYVLLKEFGIPLWESMAKQKFNFYNSAGPMSDALAAGEIALLAYGSEELVHSRWKAGAPIHYTYASPFVVVPNALLISKAAPHPNAAKLFYEFVLSPLGQQIATTEGLVSFRDDVKDERDVTKEPWYQAPGKPFLFDRKEFGGTLDQMGKDYDRIFKQK